MEEKISNRETEDIKYSSLVLAYIGDAIFEVYVRRRLILKGNAPVNTLHKRASHIVNAASQSRMIYLLEEELTPKELAVYKRGRNAKSKTAPKNAEIGDYRRATGFEALIGYLYLQNQIERLNYLMKKAVDREEENDRK